MIPRSKNRRRRNTGVTAAIVETTVGMTTTDRRTSVVISMGLTANIDNIGINDDTVRAQTMTDTRNHVGTNPMHLAITGV